MKRMLLILLGLLVLLLAGCSSTAKITARCQGPHNNCKANCSKERDVGARSSCITHCMHRLKGCEEGRNY